MNLCLWSQCSQARKKNARNRTYEPAIGEAIQVINGRGLKLPIPQLHPSQQRLLSPVYRSETYYCTVHTSLKMAFRRISCIFQTLWTLPSIPFPCRVDLQQSRERDLSFGNVDFALRSYKSKHEWCCDLFSLLPIEVCSSDQLPSYPINNLHCPHMASSVNQISELLKSIFLGFQMKI